MEKKTKETKKVFWTGDKILSTLAFIISFCTFSVLVYQTNLIRKQQYAAVLPYLEIWPSRGEDYYRLSIVNNGIGPAFIEDIKTIADGKEHEIDPANFYYNYLQDRYLVPMITATVKAGRVIPAGQSVEIFKISDSTNGATTFYNMLDSIKFDVKLTYTSVYEEKWVVKGIAQAPVALE
jgi:hypothetical protein